MRRVRIFIACLAILCFGMLSVDAQGGSIANIIAQQSASGSEFTILQQFIDASDEFSEQIAGGGNFTFLAPTDRAFRNLEGAIDFSLADLLSDVDIVTALMQYHLIDGQLSASQLRARNGQVIPTTLQNAFVGVTISDNTIVLNNVVEVTGTERAASNGIIHEINDVLLNRVINALIDERLRPSDSTTPTPEPTANPEPTPTESTDMRATANVRFGHFAADMPDVQVLFDDDILLDDISYETLTEFESIPQGIYTMTVVSLDDDQEFVLTSDVTLLNGDFLTINLIGADVGSVELLTVTDDPTSIEDDEVRMVLLNALVDAPSVSALVDGEGVVETVSYAEIETVDTDVFSGILSVVEARDSDAIYFEADAQDYAAQALYWIIVYGTEEMPTIHIVETTLSMQASLLAGESDEDDADMVEREGSIIDFLDSESNFTFLIEAVQVADADILNILGNADADSVTFLAPTDTAFANLLSTIGYSESRLLAQTDLLSDILRYHIIDEPLTTAEFIDASGTSIETILPENQAFFVRATDDGQVFLNGTIEFERTDIQVSNGIIHVVDDVLLPLAVLEALDL